MLINSKILKNLSFLISILFLIYLFYLIYNSFFIVKNQFIDIGNSTYVNQVRVDDFTNELAQFLTKDCKNNKICEVQSMLDFVTNIPYKINENVAKNPKKVVEQNFGDCDDKSNLLISLLKVKAYEAYFVLVPKHIFVIISLEDLKNKKAFYINDKKFYILETTAKDSKIGFPLKYKLNEIEAIVDPFINKKLVINSIEYK
ncbi:hypothetical protein CRU94_01455 [Arcobacter sp. AHV-9/2010]|uniref:hypothetical protein n=1 Tax=Arcobacter sp. AHV-9/2010 TaxID=2021861 RepID=UPI00100B50D0|nr:hypothetical protein [Arcobacter sp. CECT 9299]RXJ96803.1 hypothetical protein CRU94_01455 [Arcobacter sp. CECT 9299]